MFGGVFTTLHFEEEHPSTNCYFTQVTVTVYTIAPVNVLVINSKYGWMTLLEIIFILFWSL